MLFKIFWIGWLIAAPLPPYTFIEPVKLEKLKLSANQNKSWRK